MDIKIYETIQGARAARGLTVIIDVFRAFSLEPYLFSRGAREIFAVGKIDTALKLAGEHPDYIKIGERGGVKLDGFDFGNSPSQTQSQDLAGRTIIHTTSAGTLGLVNALGADEIITGSLVNARAIAGYILKKDPAMVSLVAMGLHGSQSAPEDLLCARYLKGILTGRELDMEEELKMLRESETVERFFLPEYAEVFPTEDYYLCTMVDRFDFVLGVKKISEDIFRVRKI